MFLSIKWKAILFFSSLLLLVSLAWLAVSVQKGISSLQQEINDKISRQQLIFEELITDEFQKLSQYAQLIVSVPAITFETPTANNSNIQKYIDENAFNWGLNLNMEYLLLINENQQIIAEAGQLPESQTHNLKMALYKELDSAKQVPQKKVFCESNCIQVVLEPFTFKNGQKGLVGYAQNMSELVTRYAYLSNTDIAILLDQKEPFSNNPKTAFSLNNSNHEQQNKRHNQHPESSWKPWAMSNYQTLLPILEDFYQIGMNTDLSLAKVFNPPYFYTPLTTQGIEHIGTPALYLNVFSEAKRIDAFRKSLFNSIGITLLVFVFAEIILILLLLGPLKKIRRLASIYEDLPKGGYQKAIFSVSDSKSFFKDEFSAIEQHAMQLANELKEIDEEVALSQQEFQQKVQVLSSAQNHLQQLFDQSRLYIATLNMDLTVSSTNRNLQKIFHKSLQKLGWLSLISETEERLKLTDELKLLQNKQEREIQMLITMHTQDHDKARELNIFWSYTLVADNNGDEKILAVGLPLTASTILGNQERDKELSDNVPAARAIKKSITKSYPDSLSSENSELALIVRNSVLKHDFKLLFQPRFAIKHLVIREYEALVSIENPACISLDYLTIKQMLANESEAFLIDEWLIESVFKRIKNELEYHQNIGIIIPICSCAFLDKRLLPLLAKLNSQYLLPFGSVSFEIKEILDIKTESKVIQRRVKELHEMGHEVSWQLDIVLDSTVIEEVDFDNLCLPGHFLENSEALDAVTQIVQVAKQTGISTTASGLQSKEHYLLLQQLGVDKVQGDFIKEPQTYLLNSLDIVAIQAKINNL